MTIQFHIITLSDRAFRGEYEDRSGPLISNLINNFLGDKKVEIKIDSVLIPDEKTMLENEITKAVNKNIDIVITTGGTGIGPRDITPDVVKPMLEKEITGIMELIRVKYGMNNPNALVSRSVAGIINQSLIYTLPGSTKAVNEYLVEILPTIIHSLNMIHGIDSH